MKEKHTIGTENHIHKLKKDPANNLVRCEICRQTWDLDEMILKRTEEYTHETTNQSYTAD